LEKAGEGLAQKWRLNGKITREYRRKFFEKVKTVEIHREQLMADHITVEEKITRGNAGRGKRRKPGPVCEVCLKKTGPLDNVGSNRKREKTNVRVQATRKEVKRSWSRENLQEPLNLPEAGDTGRHVGRRKGGNEPGEAGEKRRASYLGKLPGGVNVQGTRPEREVFT